MPQVDNGDYLEGVLYCKDGTKHLKVEKIKKKGKDEWQPVEGDQWMPESGGKFNGGQWLHPIEA